MDLTLRALRELVETTTGKRLPTAKALRESGCEVVTSADIGTDGRLMVYRNGFYTYTTQAGTTVNAVDRCAKYTYEGGDVLEASLFSEDNWAMRLVLAGEDRLEHNNNIREEKGRYSYSGDFVERDDLRDPHDFVAELEGQEAVESLLECLTEKQQDVIRFVFIDGYTHQQAGDLLGISKQAISKHVEAAKEKLKKKLFIFSE